MLDHLSHASSPFNFSYVSDRVLNVLLVLTSDHNPTSAFYVAGITGIRGMCLFVEMESCCCLGSPGTLILLIATSQVTGITGLPCFFTCLLVSRSECSFEDPKSTALESHRETQVSTICIHSKHERAETQAICYYLKD
jgi:hypothetical protein